MVVTVQLDKLDFGAPAAERDQGLRDYFVESESYRKLRDGERFVVLGSRGSGKSAIFRMIAEHASKTGAAAINLAPEDYSYELLSQVLAREKEGSWAKQGAFAAAWKYLIYVLVMKSVVGKGLKTGGAAKIYTYLRDRHANFATNPIGALVSYLKRLEGLKLGKHEASLKAKELHSLYRLEEISGLLPDLDAICEKRPAIVLLDELDKGWDASEDAIAFVAGLFQAAVSINQNTPHIRVLISLRRELYDSIPALYEDAQKVRDVIEELAWDEESLFDLISRRIAHATQIPQREAWEAVFAGTLDYRQTKSFNYVVDRTLYRPREVIQFCSEITREAVDALDRTPLNYTTISRAEHRYSEDRLKDIAAEYRFQNPGLLSVFETFRGANYLMDRDELETHCIALSVGDKKVDKEAWAWIEDMDPEHVIELLWRIGFIRARAVGGLKARRRSGSEYLGSHQISTLSLLGIARFHIHPMFRAFLNTKEKKGGDKS